MDSSRPRVWAARRGTVGGRGVLGCLGVLGVLGGRGVLGRLGVLGGLVLVLAGCAGGPTAGAPATAAGPASTTDASAAPSATTEPSASPGESPGESPGAASGAASGAEPGGGATGNPLRCTSAELSGSLGTAEGAAGSVYRTLLLTNTGDRTCELTGFPGVSYVAGADGHQVGPAASMSGPRGGPVQLVPGAAAVADVREVNVANYDAAVCRPTPVRGLRIYPPGDTASLFVATDGTGCAGTPPGDQLSVTTLRTP